MHYKTALTRQAAFSPLNYDSHASTKKIFCALFPSVKKCNKTGWGIFSSKWVLVSRLRRWRFNEKALWSSSHSALCRIVARCSLHSYFSRIAMERPRILVDTLTYRNNKFEILKTIKLGVLMSYESPTVYSSVYHFAKQMKSFIKGYFPHAFYVLSGHVPF